MEYKCLFFDKNISVWKQYAGKRYAIQTALWKNDIEFLLSCDEFKQFSDKYYTINDIDVIFEEKDIETFQTLNPILFYEYLRKKMLYNFDVFFVENITSEQLTFLSSIMINEFGSEAIEILRRRFSGTIVSLKPYTVLDKQTNIKYIIFNPKKINVKLKTDKENLRNIINLQYIEGKDIMNYLDIKTIYNLPRLPIFSTLEKYSQKKYVTSSFLNIVEKSYVPATFKGAIQPSSLLPEDGLYKAESLIKEYNLTAEQIHKGAKKGELGYYELSPMIIRYSMHDFNDFIRRILNYKVKRRITIADDENKYISQTDICQKFFGEKYDGHSKNEIRFIQDCFKLPMYYKERDILSKKYFLKKDVENLLSKYYGKFKNRDEFIHLKCDDINLDDFVNFTELKFQSTNRFRKLCIYGIECIYFNTNIGSRIIHNRILIRKDDYNKILKMREEEMLKYNERHAKNSK